MIQNAEDNQYTRAAADNREPYLGFNVYPDRIVVDSNEDGFTEIDVRAICSTGESTKASHQGYIGEKGIGFKSVFKVARKVHIQSGPFSFSFEHTRDSDDDGLGMVTPMNEEYEDLPETVHTRMTLTLLDTSTFDQRVQDLLSIPDTLLLFLTQLKTIVINIYPEGKSAVETKYSHGNDSGQGLEKVRKRVRRGGELSDTPRTFHVTRKEVKNLPHDDARKHTNRATVVLAFPVDENSLPVVEQQHVFAFLPLRQAGFTVCQPLS